MPTGLPEPRPGLVIGYSYLWEREYRVGQEEGTKDRPCAVIIAIRSESGDLVVTVAAITHNRPADPLDGIELPLKLKRDLGLDEAPSWLICSELNRFVWPGPDLRPVSRRKPGQFAYGVLPNAFMLRVFDLLTELRAMRRPRIIVRSP
ncbi:MAG TPA: hypothetical protein VLI93_04580 [Acetobacteraceae bacterium]|nr:hypothetical protein [Acetobacteraceae bacterium]